MLKHAMALLDYATKAMYVIQFVNILCNACIMYYSTTMQFSTLNIQICNENIKKNSTM